MGNRYRNEEPVFHSNPGGGRKRERNVSSDLKYVDCEKQSISCSTYPQLVRCWTIIITNQTTKACACDNIVFAVREDYYGHPCRLATIAEKHMQNCQLSLVLANYYCRRLLQHSPITGSSNRRHRFLFGSERQRWVSLSSSWYVVECC